MTIQKSDNKAVKICASWQRERFKPLSPTKQPFEFLPILLTLGDHWYFEWKIHTYNLTEAFLLSLKTIAHFPQQDKKNEESMLKQELWEPKLMLHMLQEKFLLPSTLHIHSNKYIITHFNCDRNSGILTDNSSNIQDTSEQESEDLVVLQKNCHIKVKAELCGASLLIW